MKNNYDTARILFKTDHVRSLAQSGYNDATNALHWMAKASLALGKKEIAKARLHSEESQVRLQKLNREIGNGTADPTSQGTY